MQVQCSILESQCHNLTESPMHALSGNQDVPTFWGIQLHATAVLPFWNQGMNFPHTLDPIQDALNSTAFMLEHDWGVDNAPGANFQQNDVSDPSTFKVTSTVIVDDEGLGVLPFNPNNDQSTYLNTDQLFSRMSGQYNWGPDFAALKALVYGVDFTPWWNGQLVPIGLFSNPISGSGAGAGSGIGVINLGFFNRAYLGNTADGRLYVSASDGPAQPEQLIASLNIDTIASIVIQGRVDRAQVQIRNFAAQTPIEYNFYEVISGFKGTPADGNFQESFEYFMPTGQSGQFTQNNQVIEIPATQFTSPQTIQLPDGEFVISGGQVRVAVGASVAGKAAEIGVKFLASL